MVIYGTFFKNSGLDYSPAKVAERLGFGHHYSQIHKALCLTFIKYSL